jgi:hypothetical protein
MIQPIQIFGWIILVVIPIIFFVAIKPEKTAQFKDKKRIICFVLMGIFALGVIPSFLDFLNLSRITPSRVQRLFSLWGFIPRITAILFPLLREQLFSIRDYNLNKIIFRFIFPLLNLLLSGGMIFFFYTRVKQLEGEKQFPTKSDSSDASGMSNKIESKFSGGVFPIFLFCIWAPILLAISLGLATPFIICTVISWICDNSTIGGKSYRFKGTAMGLFGRWILWYILTIITIGIYGFWATRNQIRWVIENVETIN